MAVDYEEIKASKQFKLFSEKEHLKMEALVRLNDPLTPREIKVVAEGDSWFDYPFRKDIIDYLSQTGYAIRNTACRGDELMNMVYNIDSVVADFMTKVKYHEPRFVIFSGGGNDVIGENIDQYLNHRNSGLQTLNETLFKEKMYGSVRQAFKDFESIVHAFDPKIDILVHGYDYAQPNNTQYQLIWGIVKKGPWIVPGFERMGWYDREAVMRPTIATMMNIFNEMLADLSANLPNFHFIDVRGLSPKESQWDNEIHLKNSGFKRVADKFHEKMTDILGTSPIKFPKLKIIA